MVDETNVHITVNDAPLITFFEKEYKVKVTKEAKETFLSTIHDIKKSISKSGGARRMDFFDSGVHHSHARHLSHEEIFLMNQRRRAMEVPEREMGQRWSRHNQRLAILEDYIREMIQKDGYFAPALHVRKDSSQLLSKMGDCVNINTKQRYEVAVMYGDLSKLEARGRIYHTGVGSNKTYYLGTGNTPTKSIPISKIVELQEPQQVFASVAPQILMPDLDTKGLHQKVYIDIVIRVKTHETE